MMPIPNEYGHTHEQVLPEFGKLDLPPGSYLVVKGYNFRHKADYECVREQYQKAMPEGVKVLFIPQDVSLSVLTVPQGPDLRTMEDVT